MKNPLINDLEQVLESTRDLWTELRGARLFITGGTGFFGSWLLETFIHANERLNLGAEAVVLTRNPAAFHSTAPHLAENPAIQLHAGDIRDFTFPRGSFSHVIHAATDASAKLNAASPHLMLDTITRGTERCLAFAEGSGAAKFLLTSSGAVYGTQPSTVSHVAEDEFYGPDPLDLRNTYAEGKRVAEMQCALAARNRKLEVKIARCFAFVGPYMKLDAHFAIGNFIRDQLAGNPIVIQGDGTPYRSYLYAADLAVWLWTILFRGESARAYNVGSEHAVSIAEVARSVASALQPPVSVEIRGTPTGAPPQRYVPNTKRARTELGLMEQTNLQQAIQRTAAWFAPKFAAHAI